MATKPRVLLISLDLQPFFDDQYSALIDALCNRATIQRAKTADPAIRKLSEDESAPLVAVLITDAVLANKKNTGKRVWDAVLAYVRRGGTAVVMGHFSSFVKPLNVKPFFEQAGLPWEAGVYHRTTTSLNRTVVAEMLTAVGKLPQSYSQKALAVKNVAPEHVWYASSPDSVIESAVFAPDNAHTPGQAAVALANVGEGRLGYLGDVNAEAESNAVVLAMCGFL
ncbi:hypothetical protein M406DRAFT_339791 [Cryphonectria parasitica EP155]|uniref:Uncharacterized protein n=1 Tax=Cryphonectria parasitica (strain ATCC 38755 / EP155) TaxID=660469 RepID=A0A9P5CMG7_CRYP1|nr:uncharacterized protein M406DRAFT_339791 [Cryphonectria parasitica EP155]KAF3764088.1 hypothetical protein M406DRAFT_339791 [Cryphonectria parasitica EP155]